MSARAPEYARKKQALIDLPIAEGSFEAFPDAVRFADGLHAAGLRLSLASSSKNVAAMLCVEDAPAGIAAARAGGMALVGIARLGDEALLQAAQADLVVTSLDQIDTAAVPDGILRIRPETETPAHA